MVQKEYIDSLANMGFNCFSRFASTLNIQWHSNMKAAQCAANIKAELLSFNSFSRFASTLNIHSNMKAAQGAANIKAELLSFNYSFSRCASSLNIQWHANTKAAQCAANIKAKLLGFNCFH